MPTEEPPFKTFDGALLFPKRKSKQFFSLLRRKWNQVGVSVTKRLIDATLRTAPFTGKNKPSVRLLWHGV
jgi:hypothetical protein